MGSPVPILSPGKVAVEAADLKQSPSILIDIGNITVPTHYTVLLPLNHIIPLPLPHTSATSIRQQLSPRLLRKHIQYSIPLQRRTYFLRPWRNKERNLWLQPCGGRLFDEGRRAVEIFVRGVCAGAYEGCGEVGWPGRVGGCVARKLGDGVR